MLNLAYVIPSSVTIIYYQWHLRVIIFQLWQQKRSSSRQFVRDLRAHIRSHQGGEPPARRQVMIMQKLVRKIRHHLSFLTSQQYILKYKLETLVGCNERHVTTHIIKIYGENASSTRAMHTNQQSELQDASQTYIQHKLQTAQIFKQTLHIFFIIIKI